VNGKGYLEMATWDNSGIQLQLDNWLHRKVKIGLDYDAKFSRITRIIKLV